MTVLAITSRGALADVSLEVGSVVADESADTLIRVLELFGHARQANAPVGCDLSLLNLFAVDRSVGHI